VCVTCTIWVSLCCCKRFPNAYSVTGKLPVEQISFRCPTRDEWKIIERHQPWVTDDRLTVKGCRKTNKYINTKSCSKELLIKQKDEVCW